MKMKKRLFAILLALCVTFTMMPLGTGGAAYAEGAYKLTLPSTRVDGIAMNHQNDAEVNGRYYRSEAPNGGNSASVESGKEVKLSCFVYSGWIFDKWTANPAGKVSIPNLCKTTFVMPTNDLTVTSTVRKLVPNVSVSQEGVLTCDAEAGHTLQVTIRQKKEGWIPRLLIRKHKKVSKINVFKGREHGTKSKNLILTGTKGADFHISALFLSPRHRQPPYGVFSYPYLCPPEKCIN